MSVLDPAPKLQFTDQTHALRLELKEWENQFAANNNGRKAGREDIKSLPEIAQKYKLYNKLRAAHPGSSGTPSSPHATKRNPPPSTQTPRKRRKQSQPLHPSLLDTHDRPLSTYNTPTAHRTSIGPTPQKDGRVLGIFDLLSPAAPTPLKQTRSALDPIYSNSLKTPSKRRLDNVHNVSKSEQENMPANKKFRVSPHSASRYASFLTPSVCRTTSPSHRTPRSSRAEPSKFRFDDTPAFLKRDSQNMQNFRNGAESAEPEYDENGLILWSPVMKVRIRPKPAGKGLSALVRGLREMEDERLDEEMDLLREMEAEPGPAAKITTASSPTGQKRQPENATAVFGTDRQAPDMPPSPDGYNRYSESDGDELQGKGRDGKPLRVWKKRGQKRSTRLVVMKPSRVKWQPEPEWRRGRDHDDEEDVVLETQLGSTIPVEEGDQDDLLDPRERGDEEHSTNFEAKHPSMEEETKDKKKGKNGKNKISNHAAKKEVAEATSAAAKERGKKRKKVAATANPNFRALKIKNKSSRANGRKRFGRVR